MQQLLPVHRFAKDPAAFCVKSCSWWSRTVDLQLTYNVRASTDPVWAAFVSSVGRGLPALFPESCIVADVDALIEAMWPEEDFLGSSLNSILTMTRADAAAINARIASQCPGVTEYAYSLDSALDCEIAQYPIEYVNSVSLSGIPDHVLVLKKGAPYLIMHNTSPVLCNGTRVIFHRRVGKSLEVEISSGPHKGEFHYVPRLLLSFTNPSIPFTLRRVQYPLMHCWAMTVHKSQGQTLDRVGIFFPRPTWAHGLLYVAVSRVRRSMDCYIVGSVGVPVQNFCSLHVLSR